MGGALAGIRVLDLSRVLAGPWATQILADLGAEVIKIERPGTGDDTRRWGPPYLKDQNGDDTEESAYYLACNRGKRSLTLDFTKPKGLRIARSLAKKSDILVENFKVGGLARHGLGYDDLKALNPRLIYCSITGFGQTGPYRHRAGYDYAIQAMGGLMSITGEPDGEPGGGPMRVGVAVADLMAGMYAISAVLAALHHRERSGEGQYIELALLDVQAAFLANQAMNALIGDAAPGRIGNRHPNIVPYQCFAVSDGDIVVAVGTDPQFTRLCTLAGRPGLAGDPRFATNGARVRHREALIAVLAPIFHVRKRQDWLDALDDAQIPCAPINTINQMLDDPQIRARGMRTDLPHPLAGTVPMIATPLNFSATPAGAQTAPPLLGEHTDATLHRLLGMSAEDVAALRDDGVV
jgi:crotonobetainyl-CoA:carnitine CoA-transferase CaiB-like acyl-CoA transferase